MEKIRGDGREIDHTFCPKRVQKLFFYLFIFLIRKDATLCWLGINTPRKFNTDPEKWWLGDDFLFGKVTFQGRAVKLPINEMWSNHLCRLAGFPSSHLICQPRLEASLGDIEPQLNSGCFWCLSTWSSTCCIWFVEICALATGIRYSNFCHQQFQGPIKWSFWIEESLPPTCHSLILYSASISEGT